MDNIQENQNKRSEAILLLRQMIDGQLPAQEAIDKWPQCPTDVLLGRIFGLLYHWRDDEDIRRKDHRYAEWQKKQFEGLIAQLERGDDIKPVKS